MTLRDDCIDAMCQGNTHPAVRELAERQLDRLLAHLEDHADEWNELVGQFAWEDEWTQQLVRALKGETE